MRPSGQETLTWLSAIVESCDDAVIGSQIDGTILSWNRGAERLYGYSAAEAIGQPVSILVPPDRLGELAKIQGTLRRGEPVPLLETVRRGKDGRPVEVSISISPIVQNGIIVGASAIARSAAERRRFEESLRDREERLSSALMASQTGTFRWHIATDVLEWDESLRRIFGITPEEPIRKAEDFLALVHAEDRPVVWAEVQRCLHEGGEFSAEFRIIRPDGAVRWIADRARLFPDKDGLPAYLTGACRDITQEKASEERLRAALAEKEALLARLQLLMKEVNHRVKNSLQTVASLLSLQGRHATSPEVRDQLADARSRVMTVAGVHERLYQSGRIGLVELPEYLQGLCADLANTLVEPPGSITIAAEAIDVALPADRVIPLGLIVTELVTNAIRHACPDGRGAVQVVARQVAIDQLAVSVRDSGIGLRSDGHSNERSGFGMKLVDGLTQQLGGTLELRHQSSGTEVVVTLPLATSTAERARDKLSATVRDKSGAGKRSSAAASAPRGKVTLGE